MSARLLQALSSWGNIAKRFLAVGVLSAMAEPVEMSAHWKYPGTLLHRGFSPMEPHEERGLYQGEGR